MKERTTNEGRNKLMSERMNKLVDQQINERKKNKRKMSESVSDLVNE